MKKSIKTKRKNLQKNYILIFLCFLFIGVGVYDIFFQPQIVKKEVKKEEKVPEKEEIKNPVTPEVVKKVIKNTVNLEVPYTVQAPFVNWNIHEESCEEAAVLMAHHFIAGDMKGVLDPTYADAEMVKMKNWQVKSYGKEPDLTMDGLAKFAKDYYDHDFKVAKNITLDNIKEELSAGNPVVVPVMTHSLKNPHYNVRNSYHVLLIKGYRADGVLANDSGIKEGKDYFYTWETLLGAIDAQKLQGREMMMIQ